MTDQEIVNFVAEKLRAQGRQSLNEDGDCQYRGPDGLRCAAGWLLADEHYSPELEGVSARRPLAAAALCASGVGKAQLHLVGALQDAHDMTAREDFLVCFNESLKELCEDHGLTYPQTNDELTENQ
jgi:hypothetical protein